MGTPVGVVPGPITSAASAGCHATLRAHPVSCVTSVSEVMQLAFDADGVLDIPLDTGEVDAARESAVDPLQTRVIDALRPRRGQSVDALARSVGESIDRIRSALGSLDLEGTAACGADGLWRRTSSPEVGVRPSAAS